MATIVINENTISNILNENPKVVIDFWASWCGPCKMIAPKIEILSEELESVIFCKVNVDENADLVKKYEIKSIPTLIAVCNRKEVSRRTGKASDEELRNFLKDAFEIQSEMDDQCQTPVHKICE
jgi:thioredoxin 1